MRTEPNAFELCRVAKNFAESKCCYTNTDCTDHTDFIYCPAEIAEIAEIIMTDGIFFHLLESSCKRACRIILSIEKSYSLCKMNKGLNVIPSREIRIIRWIRGRIKN